MSGASATVSAAPPVSAAMAPSNAAEQPPEVAGQPDPVQSFTEVLSAQRAESRKDGAERHDSDEKRAPSHGAKEVPAHGARPLSSPASQSPGAGGPGTDPTSGSAVSVPAVAVSAAATDAPEASTADDREGGAPVVDGTAVDAVPASPLQSPMPAVSTSPETAAPGAATTTTATVDKGSPDVALTSHGADLSAGVGQAVQNVGTGDGAGETPGPGASASPSGGTTSAGAAPKSTVESTAVAAPAHEGATTPSVAHEAPAPADGASVTGSTLTVPRLMDQSPLAQSDAVRAAPSSLHVGAPTATFASSVAQQAVSALDVEDLSGSISRPLSDGNGTYTVTVALHPSELGHLQAVMSLAGNELQVSLTAQTQIGHDALANATEALKDQLGRGGVNVNVTLRDPGSQSGGEERYRPPSPAGAGSFMAGSSSAEPSVPSGLVAGQIHLVL
jgi:flagellar hook-length control protein FliK